MSWNFRPVKINFNSRRGHHNDDLSINPQKSHLYDPPAHLCQLTYLFFQNVCHPCYVPWSVFVHGAFEITAPLPDFGCPKLILYWFTIFLGKNKLRHYLLCCSLFELSFNVLFFLDDITFLLTSLYFSRFPCRGVCWLCIILSGYLLTLKPICTHVGFSISCWLQVLKTCIWLSSWTMFLSLLTCLDILPDVLFQLFIVPAPLAVLSNHNSLYRHLLQHGKWLVTPNVLATPWNAF